MPEPTIIHNTFVIERLLPHPPEKVFAAFSDPAKKRKWYAESSTHAVEGFNMEFRVGGAERTRYRMNERTPFPGAELRNEGIYLDIIPRRTVVLATSMSLGERRISASLVTVELLPVAEGTHLICTHQGAFYDGSGGPEMREAGWNQLFDRLAETLGAA